MEAWTALMNPVRDAILLDEESSISTIMSASASASAFVTASAAVLAESRPGSNPGASQQYEMAAAVLTVVAVAERERERPAMQLKSTPIASSFAMSIVSSEGPRREDSACMRSFSRWSLCMTDSRVFSVDNSMFASPVVVVVVAVVEVKVPVLGSSSTDRVPSAAPLSRSF
jgi:hypothetical protein